MMIAIAELQKVQDNATILDIETLVISPGEIIAVAELASSGLDDLFTRER